jgi:hypothetical protein
MDSDEPVEGALALSRNQVKIFVALMSFLLYKFESGIFFRKIYISYMSVYMQEFFNADSPNIVVPVLGGDVRPEKHGYTIYILIAILHQ